MSQEPAAAANEGVVRRLYDYINKNQRDQFASVVAPAYLDHSNGGKGLEGFAQSVEAVHRAYADLHFELTDVVAKDDLVAIRWVETGRHVGQFFNLKPTGKPFESRGMNLFRVRDGKVVESWLAIDPATIRAQMAAQQALTEAHD